MRWVLVAPTPVGSAVEVLVIASSFLSAFFSDGLSDRIASRIRSSSNVMYGVVDWDVYYLRTK